MPLIEETTHGTDKRLGHVVGGRYRLDLEVGRGGQSIVYRATDLRDGDLVAVKVLDEKLAGDSKFRERMFREARAMTVLTGTAAVRVLDQVWAPDGALCLVMELLIGAELDDYLVGFESNQGRLPLGHLGWIFDPIVRTLEMAHGEGIVHRDLKPANIFVLQGAARDGGRVRLLDFGFAKFTRMPSMTEFGSAAGSPTYMAPECWKGNPYELDHRIDVYSLGAVLFRVLAGTPPFPRTTLGELMIKVTQEARPSLRAYRPDLPADVDHWVEQALAIEPSQRFVKVTGMWLALKAILGIA
jgi:serine/threonine protein kinase